MVDCNGRSGLSLLIESALIEQNVDEYASIFFTFSQIKQFATKKQFRKFNRQYLKNQQTVLSSPDSPCQTVLKFPEIHARQFSIFSAFYSPLPVLKSCQELSKAHILALSILPVAPHQHQHQLSLIDM